MSLQFIRKFIYDWIKVNDHVVSKVSHVIKPNKADTRQRMMNAARKLEINILNYYDFSRVVVLLKNLLN